MIRNPAIENALVRSIPDLRGYARSLCRNADRAEDIVQETLTRAIARIDSFIEGTNLEAWLFTILRNIFSDQYRQSKWSEEDVDGRKAELLTVLPNQDGWCIAADLRAGLAKLPRPYRQAIILIGAHGLGYGEAAAVAGCRVGTMKSRLNRARRMLGAKMSGDTAVPDAPASDRHSARTSALLRHRRLPGATRHAVAIESSRSPRSRRRTERMSIDAQRSRAGERCAGVNTEYLRHNADLG